MSTKLKFYFDEKQNFYFLHKKQQNKFTKTEQIYKNRIFLKNKIKI